MSDPRYVTSFEDHAKRASVGLPEAVLSSLPFDAGEELGVERTSGGLVVVTDTGSTDSALLRETGVGPRLYLDRMLAYETGLLDDDVVLVPRSDGLHVEPA